MSKQELFANASYAEMLLKAGMDEMVPGQLRHPGTYYQILLITPPEKQTPGKHITTTIVAKSKREFDEYLLDPAEQDKLKPYCHPDGIGNQIGDYLPSSGVVLSEDFLQDVLSDSLRKKDFGTVNNVYQSIRNQLQSRKISQLIAKTWQCYLQAQKTDEWVNFVHGKWENLDSEILDGLIAREIFFSEQSTAPSRLEPENFNIYYPLQQNVSSSERSQFLILPSNQAWQGIALSLLMAGQAYREIKVGGKTYYHPISQPILSTYEIVNTYGLEVEWYGFQGKIKELKVSPGVSSTYYQLAIPYPPIPSQTNLPLDNIQKWANADDEEGDLPFYSKNENGEYLVSSQYFVPPYPYLPLTCS